MIYNFLMFLMIIGLLLAEVILPIILILILGFVVWRLIQKKWIHKIFAKFIYRKNPLVRLFYEKVGHSVEEKGNKIIKPLAYIALILFIALISKILWPYVFHQSHPANSFLQDGLPSMFMYVGLIFVSFGVSASIISSFLFIMETRKFKVYNRSLEIYLLSKYLENIVYVALGVALIIGTVYFWFFTLEKLSPLFRYLENQLTLFVDLTVNFEEMLTTLRALLVSFKDQFQIWCITSFLVFLASFAVPYMWFKGRRFARIFLALFLSGTAFSYFVSFLIKKYIISELTWMYVAVWTFSALITYMVFHLINAISINKITICKHCRSENNIQLKYCGACGKKLLRRRRT